MFLFIEMVEKMSVIANLVDQPVGVLVVGLHFLDVVSFFSGGPIRAEGTGIVT